MRFLSAEEIDNSVLKRLNVYSFENVSESLAPCEDIQFRTDTFKFLLERATYVYSSYFPFRWKHVFDPPISGDYEFICNIEECIENDLDRKKVIFVPSGIYTVNSNTYRTGRRFVYYFEPILECRLTTVHYIEGSARHALYFKDIGNGKYSETSGIYGEEINKEKFLNCFSVQYLNWLKSGRDNLKISTSFELFSNLDELYNIENERWIKYVSTRANPLRYAGTKGF